MTATASKPRFKSEKKHGLPAKAFDALQEGIQEVLDDKDWAGFLENIRKISDYSFNNRRLIMFEQLRRGYPMSHWIAGKCKWRDQFKRNLKKGEFKKPIWILGPVIIKDEDTDKDVLVGFRGVKVYDVNQTEGEPLPEPDTSDMMSPIQADMSARHQKRSHEGGSETLSLSLFRSIVQWPNMGPRREGIKLCRV